MTEDELEHSILNEYIARHREVKTATLPAPDKCALELDMRDVIHRLTGEEGTNLEYKADLLIGRLAPPSPGVSKGPLKRCSNSDLNTSVHKYHARAFQDPINKAPSPAWDRIRVLEQILSIHGTVQGPVAPTKELEQKFSTLFSPSQDQKDFDLFVCYASEDRTFVTDLVAVLERRGLNVWWDQGQITLGDSLSAKIDEGLSKSRYGAVIISNSFFAKSWPESELHSMLNRSISSGEKVILPIRLDLSHEEAAARYELLRDKVSTQFDGNFENLADEISRAIKHDAPVTSTPKSEITAEYNEVTEQLKKESDAGRISILELRDEAMKSGWDFVDPHSHHLLDFIQGLRQAAQDGQISFWGRPDRNDFEGMTRKELLQKLPPDHFVDFNINVTGLQAVLVGDPLPTDNFYVMTYSSRLSQKGFADLHAAKDQALRWLRKDAEQFKGFYKPR